MNFTFTLLYYVNPVYYADSRMLPDIQRYPDTRMWSLVTAQYVEDFFILSFFFPLLFILYSDFLMNFFFHLFP